MIIYRHCPAAGDCAFVYFVWVLKSNYFKFASTTFNWFTFSFMVYYIFIHYMPNSLDLHQTVALKGKAHKCLL